MPNSGPVKLKIQTINRAVDSRKIRQKDSSSIKTINQVQQAVKIGRIKSILDSIQTKNKKSMIEFNNQPKQVKSSQSRLDPNKNKNY